MASGLPKSPRPGRKLTVAINIPKPSSDSKRFLEPSMPKSKPSTILNDIPHSSNTFRNGSGPHRPISPRPSPPNQGRSGGTRPRRHTVSVVQPTKSVQPVFHHQTFPSEFLADELDIDQGRTEADHESHKPLPVSSSFFQKAMLDLKRKPSRGSQSDDDESSRPTKENATRPPPAIEISHIEEQTEKYSLDIRFDAVVDVDDDAFGSQGDENKLSSSAPDSFLSETRKSTVQRLQLAKAHLSSSERNLNQASKMIQNPSNLTSRRNEKTTTKPKSNRKPKQGMLLSVDISPLGGPLRKWRSTEGSLPALSASIPSDGHRQGDHSPFLSSPIPRRKASMPAVLSVSSKQRSSLQDLQSTFKQEQQQGSSQTSSLSPNGTLSKKRPSSARTYSPSVSTSSALSSPSNSPTSSPRTKHETTTEQDVKPLRAPHVSPLSLKTANKITQFITSATASTSISGNSGRKNLLPDTVSLPPVLDSSGRLRVHRRRDDSMRLVWQAVNSEHNEWMNNNTQTRRSKSAMGFAED